MTDSLTKQQKNSIVLLASGTFLEYFDFMLYVHMAVLLNDLFFPKTDPFVASLIAALAFSTSFVFRIAGAFLFGWIGDNFGRKKIIIITNTLMALSCLIMALLPTYDEIGIAASILMILCRIMQSMSSLAELLGSQIYLLETIRQRPLQYSVVSSMPIFSSLGAVAALGFASLLFYFDFSWRLAFWFGVIIAGISLLARTKLLETPEFLNSQKTGKQLLEDLNLDKENKELFLKNEVLNNTIINPKVGWKIKLSYAAIESPYALFLFLAVIHSASILKNSFHYSPEQIIQHNFFVVLVGTINYLLIVVLNYKIYPLLLFRTRLIIISIFSMFIPYLLDSVSTPSELMLIQSFIMFFIPTSSAGDSIFHSHVSAGKRFRYVAITFAVTRAIMYVITSFGLTLLINKYGNEGIFFIAAPIILFTFLGLNYFFKLEREAGHETKKWFNVPYTYKENFLKPIENSVKLSRQKNIRLKK